LLASVRKQSSYIPTLDAWRAIAISMVVLHHAAMGFYARENDYYQQTSTLFGAFGVDVFFGLSGLLITKLLLEEARGAGGISLRGFYIRRVFRIMPPYLLFLTTLVVFGALRGSLELESCLFFFRNYIPPEAGGGYTQHLWSLAVEEHFYLLWPGLLVLSGTRRGRMVAAWLAIGVGLWRVVNAQSGLFPTLLPHFRTDLRLDALLWGCVAGFLLDSEAEREMLTRRLNAWTWMFVLAAAVWCVRLYSLLTGLWLAMLIPVLLAGTAVHPEWILSRVMEWKPFRWIGTISYSLYLWQEVFLAPGWAPVHVWQRWPWNILGAVAAAALSYYALERPLLRMGRRLAQRKDAELVYSIST
jgi:peptidoglycan/LPS O-acetylase OafA/YrhL